MTELKKYWLADQTGVKVLVEGAALRDELVAHGWDETDEPRGDEMVCVQHDATGARATLAAAALEVWAPRGWLPTGPTPSVDPFAEPPVAPVPALAPNPTPPVPAPSEPTAHPKSAAGGDTKER